jgi:pimeloyl-ACP methyl ester carboxylesterase
VPWLSSRPLSRLAGLENPIDLRPFDWVARAEELTAPVLILHGSDDTSVPFGSSVRLGALRPDLVDFEAFDADHTMSWNSDHERWKSRVTSWLEMLATDHSRGEPNRSTTLLQFRPNPLSGSDEDRQTKDL